MSHAENLPVKIFMKDIDQYQLPIIFRASGLSGLVKLNDYIQLDCGIMKQYFYCHS